MSYVHRNCTIDFSQCFSCCKASCPHGVDIFTRVVVLYYLDYWFYELLLSPLDICQFHNHDSGMRDVIAIDQMECLKSIAYGGFPEKMISYLGLMLLLNERQEVLMVVTNSLKQDLNHINQYIVGLALCALGNICSVEMACDLVPEVERLL